MYGPSVTPSARTVLAVCGKSSWCPESASTPAAPYFSYQAPISAIHASRPGPGSCWPASVIAPSIRYFIPPPARIGGAPLWRPSTDSTNHRVMVSTCHAVGHHAQAGAPSDDVLQMALGSRSPLASSLFPIHQGGLHVELVHQSSLGRLYHGDCLDLLATTDDGVYDLIFADPPFNLGKDYGKTISDSLRD